MSIVLTKTLQTKKGYPELFVEFVTGTETVQVTYTIETVELSGTSGTAAYSVAVGEHKCAGNSTFNFTYNGESNPFIVAEAALLRHLQPTQ